jgi:hypothetical protein
MKLNFNKYNNKFKKEDQMPLIKHNKIYNLRNLK